ncbi:excinuclease ABC subunit UvrA [Leptospirillum ferrooxidans]|uniref:UvrABC system protein A n=2 Tax=root TaxID=1 RepID=I0IQ52_LEPFC|nr:excinuclease ABC subunit UvrA [Leptospirillum ferrooxidans]BAM07401.1 excinuclease ABC, A subunit [Leptospirillum ferrooxidans C2-3]
MPSRKAAKPISQSNGATSPMDFIVIKGARQHNLKNLDISLPRNKLVVITGLSGSGKSSLAFDTLYAEGQRRYVESLSAYARQFLEMMDKPDVDSIDGLSPAIAIDQKVTSKNPRSTVGTVTEIHDYLRLLFARIGHPHCPSCGQSVSPQTVTQMVNQLMGGPEGEKLIILAPTVSDRKGEYRKEIARILKEGFTRIRLDGVVMPIEEITEIDRKKSHRIEIVIDRISLREGIRQRLAESIETGLTHGGGMVIIHRPDLKTDLILSERQACTTCNISLPEITPRLFSFNSPYGACSKCSGLGVLLEVDPTLLVPYPDLSIAETAIKILEHRAFSDIRNRFIKFLEISGISRFTPFGKLPESEREMIFHGTSPEKGSPQNIRFAGLLGFLQDLYHKGNLSIWAKSELESVMSEKDCDACGGARLNPEALAVRVSDLSIRDFSNMTIHQASCFIDQMTLSEKEKTISERILKEIRSRLNFLREVGLEYLTLSRSAGTLSGGESQRIRLATQIGSGLTGVLYILDEPSIGLHPRDNQKLLKTLLHLRDIGNTVIVVEHDEETILLADDVVDMGPGAGRMGGEILSHGTPIEIRNDPKSLTGDYLSGRKKIERKKNLQKPSEWLSIIGASEHNLRNIDAHFPLGMMTVVTGVSGSGKSTLVIDILYKRLAKVFSQGREKPGKCRELRGVDRIDKVVNIDQSPIGRTPRSNPATYTGVFTPIRDLFAQVPESRARGYEQGRFSFNVKGGRCEACQGDGVLKIEMHFLPDVYVTCDQCNGLRYNRETLEILYHGKNISEILSMTVEEALDFFAPVPIVRSKLLTLRDVGLDYIHLGQAATTLSGGEAQRIKLSKELSRRSTGKTLYILDEPTTGLHFADIQKLLDTLHTLVEQGNTVIIIEHNIDVIRGADHLIDLGPEGGDRGGQIVTTGSPEEVMKSRNSYTGEALRKRVL